jgi:hypothetical protein
MGTRVRGKRAYLQHRGTALKRVKWPQHRRERVDGSQQAHNAEAGHRSKQERGYLLVQYPQQRQDRAAGADRGEHTPVAAAVQVLGVACTAACASRASGVQPMAR